MEKFAPTKYTLVNVSNGRRFEDEGWMLDDPHCDGGTLVRADYEKKQLTLKDPSFGLYRFADWLPVRRMLTGSAEPVTYKSEGLAKKLGLKNLYITFSGYYPAVGAAMKTCSFKETEAYSVCGRMDDDEKRILVVASAGNTARAFAKVCSDNKIPLLLSVPEDNINALWFEEPLNECVKLICPQSGGDYFDAIHLSNLVLSDKRFFAEGGCKNVARREGMGTTVLSAVTHIGMIPDYYFQAVGSGTGAIAAWEANKRFIEDGRFGETKMQLLISQNTPFLPMYNAWKNKSRELPPYSDEQARRDAEEIDAKVLSNRKPPYGIIGGLYDALVDTDGDIIAITNQELRAAAEMFEQLEGVDIHPAAAVATASLQKAVEDGKVDAEKIVMLNITGGGEECYKREHFDKTGRDMWYKQPDRIFGLGVTADEAVAGVLELFDKN